MGLEQIPTATVVCFGFAIVIVITIIAACLVEIFRNKKDMEGY